MQHTFLINKSKLIYYETTSGKVRLFLSKEKMECSVDTAFKLYNEIVEKQRRSFKSD